jgi:hypothetical protein
MKGVKERRGNNQNWEESKKKEGERETVELLREVKRVREKGEKKSKC